MNKKYVFTILFLTIIVILNLFKTPHVYYLAFKIPGKQMAITFPPFGIFIESEYQNENTNNNCSILNHEMVHWEQYKRMGLFSFHYNYLKLYFKYGRINNWMEEEARKICH